MFPQSNLSYADYRDWKTLNRSFDSLSAYQRSGMTLTAAEGPSGRRRTRQRRFFRTLGVTPVLGRDFRAGEDLPSAARTVILSYAAWQARYGGAANVLGAIGDTQRRPARHRWRAAAPLSTSHRLNPQTSGSTLHASDPCDLRRSCHNLYGVARLKDGVSVESAATEMTAVARQLEKAYPDSNRGQGAAVVLLHGRDRRHRFARC